MDRKADAIDRAAAAGARDARSGRLNRRCARNARSGRLNRRCPLLTPEEEAKVLATAEREAAEARERYERGEWPPPCSEQRKRRKFRDLIRNRNRR